MDESMNNLLVSECFECNVSDKLFGEPGSGRAIYASNKLTQLLEGLVKVSRIPSSQGYNALAVISAINSLRSGSAPLYSFLKNGSATRRCIAGAGFEIEYETYRRYGECAPQTDVGIIDIRLTSDASSGAERAALWDVKWKKSTNRDAGKWENSESPNFFLRTNDKALGSSEETALKIGINGYSEGLEHAAEILPTHISRGDKTELKKLQAKGYTLFYVPQEKGALKSGWRCIKNMGHKITTEDLQAARILAGHMKEAHDKGLPNYHLC
ncbi:hypothetical protein ACJJIQ_01495 [Microbulbifer sp. ANSA003]|uniref:hypothetical protein n=1 Tax=Microbulbifer sp. ANSA003 TaxID=3243360 RepID=UPI004043632C